MFPGQPGDYNARPGKDHGEAKDLSHAQGFPDEPQVRIRFPVKFDEKADQPITNDVNGQVETGKGPLFPQQPEYGKENNPLEKSLVKLGGMAKFVSRG
jgi:hypothetical protein